VQADPRGCPRLIGLPQFFAELGYHTAYLHNGSLAFEQADVFCRAHGFREMCGQDDLQAHFAEAEMVGGWGVPDEFLMRHCAGPVGGPGAPRATDLCDAIHDDQPPSVRSPGGIQAARLPLSRQS
jgi:hypothetical protein